MSTEEPISMELQGILVCIRAQAMCMRSYGEIDKHLHKLQVNLIIGNFEKYLYLFVLGG